MVMGVPSSGMLYDVLSVRAETSVARSSRRVVSWSVELRSVGAGRGGLTPIVNLKDSRRMVGVSKTLGLVGDDKGLDRSG